MQEIILRIKIASKNKNSANLAKFLRRKKKISEPRLNNSRIWIGVIREKSNVHQVFSLLFIYCLENLWYVMEKPEFVFLKKMLISVFMGHNNFGLFEKCSFSQITFFRKIGEININSESSLKFNSLHFVI